MKRFFLFAMIAAIGIFVIGCEKAAPREKTTNDPAHPAIFKDPGETKTPAPADTRSRDQRDIRNPDGQHRSRVR